MARKYINEFIRTKHNETQAGTHAGTHAHAHTHTHAHT